VFDRITVIDLDDAWTGMRMAPNIEAKFNSKLGKEREIVDIGFGGARIDAAVRRNIYG